MKSILLFLVFLGVCQSLALAGQNLTPTQLRCENRVDPLGLDEPKPRLSWQVVSSQRGQQQTAYHILVASSLARLNQNQGDLWDSGQVNGDETIQIGYAGKPLVSNQPCFWKVKVWDKNHQPSGWSQPALWSMGLLKSSDWQAEWIGCDPVRQKESPEAPFEGAQWIWFGGDPGPNFPKGQRVFMAQLRLPENITIRKAELRVSADDRCWFNLNGNLLFVSDPVPDNWKRPRKIDVSARLRPGLNTLRVQVENTAEGPAGLLAKLVVTAGDGQTITQVTDGSWRATDQPGANWHNRPIGDNEWPACQVVGNYGIAPWGKLKDAGPIVPPPVYLRTVFTTRKTVKRAVLFATALGWFDVHINGKRVADERFNPGWTDYAKRVYYRAYDVTPLLQPGENAWGAILSDGWYSGYIGWDGVRNHYGQKPRFLGQLHLEYSDGSNEVIASGPGWKAASGPMLEADILMGEVFDARLSQPGWDKPAFNDQSWFPVNVGRELNPLIQAHPGPPVRAIAEFKPVRITAPQPGVYVLDLGQNFAGVPRLKVRGAAGQKITLRFAERLNPDGTIYTANLRSARATDTYICRGGGLEIWEPRFTFHGFQYIEVTGLKKPPTKDTVVGLALSSDTPVAGQFTCSDPMLNRLRRNIYWTQRANFIDIPTDCPQRDERLGWTGDAQVYVRTATLYTDVEAFFTKWLVDLEDGQRADGQFPMVAPVKGASNDGGPAWADAGVICPWTIYEVYGDRRILERHYESMKRFIAFCQNRCQPGLLPPDPYHCFGDWLSIKADTPKDVIFLAYFAYSTKLTARAAEALGHRQEAADYNALFGQIKASFNRAYVDQDGRIKGNTQAGYVLALAFDLVDGEPAKHAAHYLVEDIENRGGHLSTGFIGTKDLMLVLAKIGRHDVAYRLIHNDTFPSWGFSMKHGATSIWERWDGWTPENGFQDPGMNSFAHYSFGAVYQWMVENIGGIRNDGAAYQRLFIAPQPGGKLTRAMTQYDSIRGPIQTRWQQQDGRLVLDVTIPANTSARVKVPAASADQVTESRRALNQAPGVKLLGATDDGVLVAVGSGHYHFVAKNTR
jgi:alpha-L-rhamnosidase